MSWRTFIAKIISSLAWPIASIIITVLVTRFVITFASRMPSPTAADSIKNGAETLGFAAAAIFFLYKAISGYLIVNLSIVPSADRQAADGGKDHLTVVVKLSKGDRGAVDLHDAQAQITWSSGQNRLSLKGLDRLSFVSRNGDHRIKRINWDRKTESSPVIRLSPGEDTVFSSSCLVPASAQCEIEIAVLGKRRFSWRYGQWRASLVSLPTIEESGHSR